jgi:Enoyl-(Acyl carrier protein) reductase
MPISESIASVLDTCLPVCKDFSLPVAFSTLLPSLQASLPPPFSGGSGTETNPFPPVFPYRTRKILDDNPDLKKQWTSLIPVGKMGRPEDLMGAVTFLLSEASGYVTGADLRIDGGYTVT